MCEELREREAKRRNIILHGLEEPSRKIKGNRDRMEDDLKACLKVLQETGTKFVREDMKCCRRIGERREDGEKPRPVVIGLRWEVDKDYLLERTRKLKGTRFDYISIVADLTKRQRQEEEDQEAGEGEPEAGEEGAEVGYTVFLLYILSKYLKF